MLSTNETKTVIVPIAPEIPLLTFFPKKTLKRNPANGDKSSSIAKLLSIPDYPFKFFKLAMSIEPMFRKTETRIASPTATSAAATAIEKNTKTCPSASWWNVEKATNNKFTAFSMISIDMKTMMAFLLYNTPKTPMQNRSTDRKM